MIELTREEIIRLMEQQGEVILDILQVILEAEPEGIREYDLLKRLENQETTWFLTTHHQDPFVLFRSHFLLFHLLYKLRSRLRTTKSGDLDIHCLRIILYLTENAPVDDLPGPCDSLSDYYNNLDNLWDTSRDDVLDMMVKFWRQYERFCYRLDAFNVFGLPQNAPVSEIKHRFRELVRQTHPDMGGNTASFQRIMQAAASLLP